MHAHVLFFKSKDKSFICWISNILKPIVYDEGKYVFQEGEEITESKILLLINNKNLVFFHVKGSCGFVLIRFENEIYKLVG